MDIPCKKCDMDYDGNYMSFLTSQIDGSLSSKLTPNSMLIPYSMSCMEVLFVFSMLEHDMDFGQVQVIEFPWHLLRK